jgi:biopolymer transport protein ExbB
MKKFLSLLRVSLALCAMVWSGTTWAWWNEDWPYRMAINVDASATGANLSETNQEMTVLLKFHSGNFADFLLIKEGLADFRFMSGDDKTPLKYHVEHADLINQLIYVWVKLPAVTGGINTEKFWLYYGNEQAVAAEDAKGSFDANTSLTYHFSSKETIPTDATAYATPVSEFTGTLSGTSVIASGAVFAAGNRLKINDTPTLAVTADKGLSVSLWLKPQGVQTDSVIFDRNGGVQVILRGTSIFARYKPASGAVYETAPATVVKTDTWQHIALVLAPTSMTLYVEGNAVGTTAIVLEAGSGNWAFGGALAGGQDFVGEMDEIAIATNARNASWIKASANSQGPSNTLIIPQAAEQLGAGGEHGAGMFTVLLKSVDEAGWAVISVMAVMFVISWMVMIGKFIYVRRVKKDNVKFLRDYNKIKFKNPALLDHEETEEDQEFDGSPMWQAIFGKHDHYQSSPIYRLYHRGIQEVEERMPKSIKHSSRGLNAEAVHAIRAALEAQSVREVQRLMSKMVYLTISVSGGPFLGLLGTVIGVMMTFGAIAMTGDVNISAIAPGVAAALLATVAGLLVAIPALFGYNYLMSVIKENIADMKVFVDEYVTRLAEYYSEVSVVKAKNIRQANID